MEDNHRPGYTEKDFRNAVRKTYSVGEKIKVSVRGADEDELNNKTKRKWVDATVLSFDNHFVLLQFKTHKGSYTYFDMWELTKKG